ncbi:hypothetical protein HanPI659440_Chr04g0181451 [Helianthus annuus]|nr:hypothetical protein HanPI659440_Chr04g0181451 [Helianthus annuus]
MSLQSYDHRVKSCLIGCIIVTFILRLVCIQLSVSFMVTLECGYCRLIFGGFLLKKVKGTVKEQISSLSHLVSGTPVEFIFLILRCFLVRTLLFADVYTIGLMCRSTQNALIEHL